MRRLKQGYGRISMAVTALALIAFMPNKIVPEAHALSLVPISQDFEPSGKGATHTFRVENATDDPVAVVIKAMTRDVSIDGEETNAETRDFFVFPGHALIAPRQSQSVRVQWRGTDKPSKELAYRIVAEQLPIKGSLEPNARAIQIVIRYVGSLYVLPSGASPDVVVETARMVSDSQNRRVLELVLNNRGTSHALIDEPELTLSVGGISHEFKVDQLAGLLGENMLAESRRRFFLPWPDGLPEGKPEVEFKYTPLR